MKSVFSALLLFLSFASFHAFAWTDQPIPLDAKLLTSVNGIGAKKELFLGLDIDLSPGWHTYWKLPGDTGAPPEIDWSGSQNIQSTELLFPAPTRINTPLSDIIGYTSDVLFPIRVKINDISQNLVVKAKATILACKDLCVPVTIDLNLTVPSSDNSTHSADYTAISKSLSTVPNATTTHGIDILSIKRLNDGIEIMAHSKQPFISPDAFIYNPEEILFTQPLSSFDHNKQNVRIESKLIEPLPEYLDMDKLPLTVSIVDGKRSAEVNIPAATSANIEQPTLLLIMFIALIGGLILNIMPCVLPVLSIKLMSVIKQTGQNKASIRRSFLTTAAGILSSFLIIGSITLALKHTGTAVGWGIQFQNPLFLLFLIIVLTLFAANMWGLFNISLPHSTLSNVSAPSKNRVFNDFATGLFATLLATPCTAPFLGTAISFALAAGTKEIFIIFFMLGLGMALPYLVVSAWPSLAGRLPKPGAWMTTTSHFLGIGLALTVLWLLYVLKAQTGVYVFLVVGVSLVALLTLIYYNRKSKNRKLYYTTAAIIITFLFFLTSFSTRPVIATPEETLWTKFDLQNIDESIVDNKVVFIDITADWCLNCKFNKEFILNQAEVQKAIFNSDNVIAMQGNWTNPDPIISKFLNRHGRYGIPFNVVYGPRAPNGIPLPEILTPTVIFDALEKAKGNNATEQFARQ